MCREQKNTEAYECIELGQVELGTVSVEDSQIPDIGGYHTIIQAIIQANTNRNRANWAKYTT